MATMFKKFSLAPLLCGLALLSATSGALASGSEAPGASDKISVGTMSILVAPVASVAGGANPAESASIAGAGSAYVVSGVVQGSGESVEVILDAVGAAGKLSVKLSKSAVNGLALSTGTAVRVISETTGTLLVVSGKVIAFIPNKLGEALLSQSRVPAN